MKRNPENNRWLYESLVPASITDPAEREAYIQRLMESDARNEGTNDVEYFSE